MKPEDQRIAIAEACPGAFRIINGKVYWKNDDGICDPLNDLNACHEMEKALDSFSKRLRYYEQLRIVRTPPEMLKDGTKVANSACICAAAAQRAEAFLRTIGKWRDE